MKATEPTDWNQAIEKQIREFGGGVNAHTHLDRANTNNPQYWNHVDINPEEASELPLSVKQDLVGDLHKGPAYEAEDLYERMKSELNRMISRNTKRVISFIDASPDIGFAAIEQAVKLKEELKTKIDLQIAVSPIFGFKRPVDNPDRWEIYQRTAKIADILGGLPSRDEEEGRIGADEHMRRIIVLGQELHKPVHFQIDQKNIPEENETETLVKIVHRLGSPKVEGITGPTVWAIHVISPSCYREERFEKLIEGLLKENIGVICCPTAALSMLQLRSFVTPTHNSIARILEMAKAGIRVQLGTDNINDIFIPNGDGSIRSEIWIAATVYRFCRAVIWAKIGAGIPLNNVNLEYIARALYQVKKQQ